MCKVLVIGGAGSAGISLIESLKNEYEIEILDIVSKNNSYFKDSYIPYHWKSIQDIKPDDVKDYNIIVHFAAQADAPLGYNSPVWTCYQNIYGSLNLFECARYSDKLEKIIIASSGTEYGKRYYVPIDEKHPLIPTNPYSWSKASQEMCAMTYYYSYKLPVVVLGSGVIVGPHMRKEIFLYKWLYNLLNNKPISIEGGEQTRDITYISDVVDAYKLILQRNDIVGEKFQISSGVELSLSTIAEMCLDECNKDSSYLKYKPYRPGEEGMMQYFSIWKAKVNLGYNPKVKPKKSIKLVANWIRENEQ